VSRGLDVFSSNAPELSNKKSELIIFSSYETRAYIIGLKLQSVQSAK